MGPSAKSVPELPRRQVVGGYPVWSVVTLFAARSIWRLLRVEIPSTEDAKFGAREPNPGRLRKPFLHARHGPALNRIAADAI